MRDTVRKNAGVHRLMNDKGRYTMKYLLKNGTVVSGEKSEKLDVLVEGEKIINVGRDLGSDDAEVIDVTGKLLFPGFIDGHTHFDLEVAGTVTADDFETGTRAALLRRNDPRGDRLCIDRHTRAAIPSKKASIRWHQESRRQMLLRLFFPYVHRRMER